VGLGVLTALAGARDLTITDLAPTGGDGPLLLMVLATCPVPRELCAQRII